MKLSVPRRKPFMVSAQLAVAAVVVTVLVMVLLPGIKNPSDNSIAATRSGASTAIARSSSGAQTWAKSQVQMLKEFGPGCKDSLPICGRAAPNPYVLDSNGERVLNDAALFFCPCLAKSLGAASAAPPEVGLRVWETVVNSLDAGQEEVLIKLILDSKLYIGKAKAITSIVPKGYLRIWSTSKDDGVPTVFNEMQEFEYLQGGVFNDNELAIDIGSNMGIVSMLLAFKFPNMLIVGIEAVSFTWMYQQINLWNNLPLSVLQSGRLKMVLAALSDEDGQELRFQFRDDSLTSSRNWNPSWEKSRTLCEVTVRTRSFHSLLDELFGNNKPPICWIKVDCEGCEYAFVPQLSMKEFAEVKSWAGEMHYYDMTKWAPDKSMIPPLTTIRLVHERICRMMQCRSYDFV